MLRICKSGGAIGAQSVRVAQVQHVGAPPTIVVVVGSCVLFENNFSPKPVGNISVGDVLLTDGVVTNIDGY